MDDNDTSTPKLMSFEEIKIPSVTVITGNNNTDVNQK